MKTAIAAIVMIVVLAGGYILWEKSESPSEEPVISSFEDCARYFAVMESYPRQCRTPDGRHFVENIGNELDKSDLIRIASPRGGEKIASPLTITGEARGYWYFEASFPVELRDASGKVLAQHYATAQDEWMTEDFVPFESALTFPPQPSGSTGVLILHKDNPSGLPEHDDELEIPVTF